MINKDLAVSSMYFTDKYFKKNMSSCTIKEFLMLTWLSKHNTTALNVVKLIIYRLRINSVFYNNYIKLKKMKT